jgi:hypothetical protein
MSAHRGVLAAVALLLLAAVPACGFADDNYDNAQAALDRSKPDLTVPETVTTMAPYQTIPGDDTSGSIPVELATPAQRAAALAEAQQRADDRKAGRVSGSGTAGGTAGGAAGGTPTAAGPTTTTVPDTPACRASRQLQVVGGMVVLSPKDSLTAYRESISALGGVWRQVQQAVPADNRPLVDGVVGAYVAVEVRAGAATTTSEVRAELTGFLQSQSKQITKVLTVLTSLCPEVIDSGQDQAETIKLDN